MNEYQTQKAIKTFWILFIVPVVLMFVLFMMISAGYMGYMPNFKELENPESNLASEVISSDRQLLGKYYRENRTIVQFENLPTHLVNALVATEDIRFYDHSGIDVRGLFRVLFRTVILRDKSGGGGSTITQQLAKNLFPRDSIIDRSVFHLALTKFKEWVIAVKLERNYTKEEILAMYLNTVPFGSETFGIKTAAHTYFNTSPDSLNIQQAATLVGMVKGPSKFNPKRNPKNAFDRRNTVFSQMEKYGFITEEEFDSLKLIPLKLDYRIQSHNEGKATYFREYLRTTMNKKKPEREDYSESNYEKYKEDSIDWVNNPLYGWCNKKLKPNGEPYDLYSDGLKIYTTINYKMQQYAEEAVAEHMGGELQPLFYKHKKGNKKAPFDWQMTDREIGRIYYNSMVRSDRYQRLKRAKMDSADIIKNFRTPTHMQVFKWSGDVDTIMTPLDSIKYYKFFLHTGFISMEPQTGYVKAYVGDINIYHFKYDNVMQTRRQVGSTFKPIIYTMAMMPGGYSPCHLVPNIPVSFEMPNGQPEYTPRYSVLKGYEGKLIPLRMGLAYSLNQISAWVLKQYSPSYAVDLARKMGIRSPLPEVYSLCVGSADIKLSEMVGAYGTFFDKGVYTEPMMVTRIEDKNGNVIQTFKPKKNEVISEGTAYRMISLMQGVVQMGTSVRLRYKYKLTNDIAGKTGTTNDNSDGWFIGGVPNLVSGVWVGGEERSIRFSIGALGEGANMALPIWALYMQKIYKDGTLDISKDNFELPESSDGIPMDCSKYSEVIPDDDNYINPDDERF
ncbi:MAG: transglycosylase domain-containing protein [Bacteroidales bacterium]